MMPNLVFSSNPFMNFNVNSFISSQRSFVRLFTGPEPSNRITISRLRLQSKIKYWKRRNHSWSIYPVDTGRKLIVQYVNWTSCVYEVLLWPKETTVKLFPVPAKTMHTTIYICSVTYYHHIYLFRDVFFVGS